MFARLGTDHEIRNQCFFAILEAITTGVMTASSVRSKRKKETFFQVSPYRYVRQKLPKNAKNESFYLISPHESGPNQYLPDSEAQIIKAIVC